MFLVLAPLSASVLSLSELDEAVERDETADSTRDNLDEDLLLPFTTAEPAVLSFVEDASLEADVLGWPPFSPESRNLPLADGEMLPSSHFSANEQ